MGTNDKQIVLESWDRYIACEFIGNIISPNKEETFSESRYDFPPVIALFGNACQSVYNIECQHTLSQIILPIHFGSGAKGRRKSILCTSYNSWFLVLKEHPICIPHWVFHPLCTAANFCPTCLEVIQLTKTFQSGRVFLRAVLLTCG